ncbi:oligosaccharide flippase family protein [Halobaculum litoreum]|uniref:Oligosaccharide flippase family protein n=1 Tax=Halobaculum litoreum TaxID=3031998 RepID=A0ABD5XSF8_9EURY
MTAGAVVVSALFVLLAASIAVFDGRVTEYIGFSAVGLVIATLGLLLCHALIDKTLIGLHLTHVSGVLKPVQSGGRALFQVLLVLAGAGTVGLLLGHAVGLLLAIVIGVYYAYRSLGTPKAPRSRHFRDLFEFAKFSWLGGFQARTFNFVDVIVLGLFVPSGLIGIYSVAWNLGQFLFRFSGTLTTTLFPEMSKLSARNESDAFARIVEQSLSFGGCS